MTIEGSFLGWEGGHESSASLINAEEGSLVGGGVIMRVQPSE